MLLDLCFHEWRHKPPIAQTNPEFPEYAGAAAWSRGLQNDIGGLIELFERAEHCMLDASDGSEVASAQALHDALKEFQTKM